VKILQKVLEKTNLTYTVHSNRWIIHKCMPQCYTTTTTATNLKFLVVILFWMFQQLFLFCYHHILKTDSTPRLYRRTITLEIN